MIVLPPHITPPPVGQPGRGGVVTLAVQAGNTVLEHIFYFVFTIIARNARTSRNRGCGTRRLFSQGSVAVRVARSPGGAQRSGATGPWPRAPSHEPRATSH